MVGSAHPTAHVALRVNMWRPDTLIRGFAADRSTCGLDHFITINDFQSPTPYTLYALR